MKSSPAEKTTDNVKKQLSPHMREKLIQALADSYLFDSLFDPDVLWEYFFEGVTFKGLNRMTDEELLKEYVQYVEYVPQEESLEALYQELELDMAVNNMVDDSASDSNSP
jgi:hypothetical protein